MSAILVVNFHKQKHAVPYCILPLGHNTNYRSRNLKNRYKYTTSMITDKENSKTNDANNEKTKMADLSNPAFLMWHPA